MMRWTSFATALIALASASKFIPSDGNSFTEIMSARDLVLVEFCVPWYEPCKNLSPGLDRAAKTLSKRDISVVSIDCTAKNLQSLCKDYGVQSYPAIRVFKGLEENSRYRGRQEEKAITSFLIKQTLPTVSSVDEENLQELKSLGLPVLLAFMDANDKKSQAVFKSVAEALQPEFIFGKTSNLALFEENQIDPPFIVLYNPLDEADLILQGDFGVDEISRFAEASSEPLVGMFGPDTFAKYTDSDIPLALTFAETAEERKALARILKDIAAKYSAEMNFVTVDAKKYGFFSESLGLDASRFPGFVIHDTRTDEMYQFDQSKEITIGAIEEFVEDFFRRVSNDEEMGSAAETIGSSKILAHDEI